MNVRLEKKWTDPDGVTHDAGETVDVDAATLADLQKKGIVAEWAGPTGGGTANWAGPTTTEP